MYQGSFGGPRPKGGPQLHKNSFPKRLKTPRFRRRRRQIFRKNKVFHGKMIISVLG